MKRLILPLIACALMACDNSSNRSSAVPVSPPVSTTVGAFALELIESQTSDETEPVDVNSLNFNTEDTDDEFIAVGA